MDLAAVLLMNVRGIPIIYYGDEQYPTYYNDNDNIKESIQPMTIPITGLG